MKPPAERAAIAAACLLGALFLVGATYGRVPSARSERPGSLSAVSFHGGKTAGTRDVDAGCRGDACHDPYPHRKDRTNAPFLNMHRGFAECLACHGKEAEKEWIARTRPEGKGTWLGFSREAPKGNPHEGLGTAAACRKCHSESGREILRAKGMSGLTSGFANPISLRMIEGGARRWAPGEQR